MEILKTMITDTIKQSAGNKYYKHKKDESKKGKATKELEKQHVSLVRSGRGKGYMFLGNQKVNVPCKPKKAVVPKKPKTLIVADNIVEKIVAVKLVKPDSIEEQRLQKCEIMTQLTIERQVEKYVEDTYAAETRLKLKGVGI
nr:hypothetical protein [Tanacetum cinerariifolium]